MITELDPLPLIGPLGHRYPLYEDWWTPAYTSRTFAPRPQYSQSREDYS